MMKNLQKNKKIIFFDGVCNLCSGFLSFIYRYDHKAVFHFSWIQSAEAVNILQMLDLPIDNFKTIVYIENGHPYFKSDAILKIVKLLKFPWPLLRIGIFLPRIFRDWIYDIVARNRYKWFGRKDQCMIPTGDLKRRFL